MKTIAILFTILILFSSGVNAGLPPTSTQGSNDANPVTTFKFLFPNVTFSHSGTSATFGTVGVASGGTGAASLTANNVILGNGTSAVQFVAPGTSGNMLVSNGTTWTSSGVSGSSLMSAPGISGPKTCYFMFGGASATLASPTNCTTGTCVEIYDSCSAATSPSFSSTGVYVNLTWANGTWANSTALACDCVAWDSSAGNPRRCFQYFDTGEQSIATNSSGGAVISMLTYNSSDAATNTYVVQTCTGQAP